jgi:hypothetical protein
MPPNKHMLRAERHKVLSRGRQSLVLGSASRARVLMGLRAGADVGRWAASATLCVRRQCKLLIAQVLPKMRASASGASWLQSDC